MCKVDSHASSSVKYCSYLQADAPPINCDHFGASVAVALRPPYVKLVLNTEVEKSTLYIVSAHKARNPLSETADGDCAQFRSRCRSRFRSRCRSRFRSRCRSRFRSRCRSRFRSRCRSRFRSRCRSRDSDLDAALDSDLDAALDSDLDAALDSDLDAALDSDLDAALDSDLNAVFDDNSESRRTPRGGVSRAVAVGRRDVRVLALRFRTAQSRTKALSMYSAEYNGLES
ncbi:hypothetical protein EVAR_48589_1 [Eumeta japonica]|uniref:Uncharacterized protein n=1 Tax=Eumeta variegata TaxID=151549 RepID=A0A4C1YZ57_EUMVA|nr:hypothetical protein EVAR_48589_1 [Eumeta japonica]